MLCPRTGKDMNEIEVGGVKIDVSTGCGGVWFDNFEFKKFDEPHESAGEKIVELMEKYRSDKIDLNKKLNCPHHTDTTMMRHFFSVKRKVEIDECPECAGVWLDPGELAQIRSLFPNEKAKGQAADTLIAELFKSPEIQAMKKKNEEGLAKARRFANMFKFVCPTYYIPGKQDWGAF